MFKKNTKIILIALMTAAVLAGCGKDSTETADQTAEAGETAKSGGISTKDINTDEYVTVGDYGNLFVEVPVYNYTDEDVETEMNGEIEYFVQQTGAYDYEVVDKDTVENGDMVNIDYKGLKDGVAFDGGTAEGAHLTIGSGQFIDGFESGLEGHKVGEEVSLNLTFPEQYHSEELAGQAVVFEVKINAIEQQKTPELSDELVAKLGLGVSTVDEFRADTENYLKEQVESKNASEKRNAIWQAVYETCEVKEPPKELTDDVLERIRQNLTKYAQQYNVSEDDFIVQYMGSTREQYEADSLESATGTAKEKLVAAAIAKKEGITVTKEDMDEYAAKDAETYGYESGDKIIEEYGEGAYYDYVLGQKVDDFLVENIKTRESEPVSIMTTAQ